MTQTQLSSHTYPIVGAYYRPPAQAILKVLPIGSKLTLVPEPENEFDSNAIAIWLDTAQLSSLSDAAKLLLESEALNSGILLKEILAKPEHHLGFIPKAIAAKLKLNDSLSAKFTTSLDGKPAVIFSL